MGVIAIGMSQCQSNNTFNQTRETTLEQPPGPYARLINPSTHNAPYRPQ